MNSAERLLRLGLPLLLTLASLVFAWQLGTWQIERLEAQPAWCYADASTPLLTNLDGFYYLRQAERLQQGAYAAEDPLRWLPGPSVPPALSLLLLQFAKATGQDLQRAGLWLPLLLGALLALPLAIWGARIGGSPAACAGAVFGMLSPAWLMAMAAGRLDTATLPPVLMLLAAGCWDALLQREKGWPQRLGWALAGLGCVALLGWWWLPGLALAALWLPLLGAALLCAKRSRLCAVLVGLLLAAACAAAAWWLVPGGAAWLQEHAALLLATGGTLGSAIAELQAREPLQLVRLLAGSPAGGAVTLVGLCWLLLRQPRRLLALAPLVPPAVAAFYAERFSVFAVPLVALGLAGGVALALHLLQRFAAAGNPAAGMLRGTVVGALCLVLLQPGLRFAWEHAPRPEVTRGHDLLALELREAAQARPQALVWSWWDWGYFLQYRTGLRTLFDGGSQSRQRAFVAAVPLAAPDDGFARRWMRFFAAHGPGMFPWLSRRLEARGGEQAAAAMLLEIMRQPRTAAEVAARHGLHRTHPKAYFFPEGPEGAVAVFAPLELLAQARTWLALARGSDVAAQAADRADYFPIQEVELQQDAGLLPLQAREKGWPAELPLQDLEALRLPQDVAPNAGARLFVSRESPLAFVADGLAARSLAFRLLAPVRPRPEGFEVVVRQPGVGGVWLLAP